MMTVAEAGVSFQAYPLGTALRLSSGTITDVIVATATVTVEVNGRRASGSGAVCLSDLWAWPETGPRAERLAAMRRACEQLAALLPVWADVEQHPLAVGLQLNLAARAQTALPPLAAALCASPFDAALHDAVGRALDCSAFELYAEPAPIPQADHLFPDGAVSAVRALLQPRPGRRDAWLVVAGHDVDIAARIRQQGFRCFKLKLSGHVADDAALTIELCRRARAAGVAPTVCADSNGAFESPAEVLAYLDLLDRETMTALAYLEQPCGRDLLLTPRDWRPVAARKPVIVDEGLYGLEVLAAAASQGWSGLALKTAKGHSLCLVAAAWARQQGMMVTLQDLTNPGLAAVHGALFSGWVPVDNGLELNSPQFLAAANTDWTEILPDLFDVRDGCHGLPPPRTTGLGSCLGVIGTAAAR